MMQLASIDEKVNGKHGGTKVDYDETNVQQQTRVEPINVGRPKKIQKCSYCFVSLYTNPCHKRWYHRDKGLVYDPLREIPKEKKEAFNKYLESNNKTPI